MDELGGRCGGRATFLNHYCLAPCQVQGFILDPLENSEATVLDPTKREVANSWIWTPQRAQGVAFEMLPLATLYPLCEAMVAVAHDRQERRKHNNLVFTTSVSNASGPRGVPLAQNEQDAKHSYRDGVGQITMLRILFQVEMSLPTPRNAWSVREPAK